MDIDDCCACSGSCILQKGEIVRKQCNQCGSTYFFHQRCYQLIMSCYKGTEGHANFCPKGTVMRKMSRKFSPQEYVETVAMMEPLIHKEMCQKNMCDHCLCEISDLTYYRLCEKCYEISCLHYSCFVRDGFTCKKC